MSDTAGICGLQQRPITPVSMPLTAAVFFIPTETSWPMWQISEHEQSGKAGCKTRDIARQGEIDEGTFFVNCYLVGDIWTYPGCGQKSDSASEVRHHRGRRSHPSAFEARLHNINQASRGSQLRRGWKSPCIQG